MREDGGTRPVTLTCRTLFLPLPGEQCEAFDEAQRMPHSRLMSEFDLRSGVGVGLIGVSRSRNEDQRLGSTVGGRLRRGRDHSCRSFTHQSSWPAFDHMAVSTCSGGLSPHVRDATSRS